MGQYYKAINIDKKEKIKPFNHNCFSKLMEFSYISKDDLDGNDFTNTLHALIQTSWKGDRVYLVGDYANFKNHKDIDDNWLPTLESLKDEFKDLGIVHEKTEMTLYHITENFKDATPLKTKNSRYIYNSKTKEYIDLKALPVQWKNDDDTTASIDPLPLLICMGNDRGGGDYRKENNGYQYVSKWVSTSEYIFFDDELLEGYKEFKPDFYEK